ncbi:DNA translocase FtsK [uncultured Rikenella sp.]|uniref:FtsK/SpoIIIE family DNA translocase n=1 Tax=uncultured Rikenella sp. TaxID=368003 RepID=UPI00262919B7|nr:DNA translocase FtsK [uncultured Rikenella sp.]
MATGKRQTDELVRRAQRDRELRRKPAERSGAPSPDRLRTERVQRVTSRRTVSTETSDNSRARRDYSPAATRKASSSRSGAVTPTNRAKTKPTTRPSSSNNKTAKPTKRPASRIDPESQDNHTDRYIWLSLILLFLSGYLAVSTFSYLIYWDVDQNIATWSNLFVDVRQDALNWGGRIGAILAQSIIGRWFGIFGELVPVILFCIALKLLRVRALRIRRVIRSLILLMIVGSIGAGHFFGPDPQIIGSGWGGAHGIFIAQWLNAMIGYEGTSLLIIAAFVGILYYANHLAIRHAVSKYRAYARRKREERHVRQELERLQARKKMMRLKAEAEIRRQALAEQQPVPGMDAEPATPPTDGEAQPAPAVAETAAEAAPQNEPETAPLPPPVYEQPPLAMEMMGTEIEPDAPMYPEYPIQNGGYSPFVDPNSTAQESAFTYETAYQPEAAERARLVQNYDGSWGYLMGYDEWSQPIIYSFDWQSYYYDPYRYSASIAPPVPTGIVPERTEAVEEEVSFTVATRPIEEPAMPPSMSVPAPTPVTETEKPATTARKIPLQPTVEEPVAAPQRPVFTPEPTTERRPELHATEGEEEPGSFIVEQPEEEQVEDEVINNSDLYDPTLELSHYRKPPIELLDDHTKRVVVTDQELVENKNRIVTTLENFGIRIDTIEATIGPTVTLYEIVPAPGVRISKIKNLEDDIALSLSALGIRIIAPIPGKGTVGIEVPNKNKEIVSMYSVIKSPRFHDSRADLPVALGKTIQNETFVFDLAKMPHLLVAGATGQGKSVGLNAIITSLLYKKHPAELKFVLVDPKKVELTLYSKLEKHFLAKMPTEDEAIITDTQKVIYTLNSLCIEMDARYDLLKAAKVRNIKEYNEKFINRRLNPEKGHRFLPYFVVIVDEFADLIMTAGREIETPIARIAQLARAVGIHLIIATQRPTTNIITGVIKANFPARIAFRVTSMIDSRTILDQPGANQLVGRGDMLISTGSEVTRVQCAFIDTPEVERITDHIEHQQGYPSAYELPEYTPEGDDSSSSAASGDVLAKRDSLFEEVARYVVANQQGSASTIQRKFSIGFNRAGRLIDQLEAAGIVGHSEGGGKPRQVLVTDPMSLEMILDNL